MSRIQLCTTSSVSVSFQVTMVRRAPRCYNFRRTCRRLQAYMSFCELYECDKRHECAALGVHYACAMIVRLQAYMPLFELQGCDKCHNCATSGAVSYMGVTIAMIVRLQAYTPFFKLRGHDGAPRQCGLRLTFHRYK